MPRKPAELPIAVELPKFSPKDGVAGFPVNDSKSILVAAIPGAWLLKVSTPSWRSTDPLKGFQRIVDEERCKQIAKAVLDEERPFPNSVVLATDKKDIGTDDGKIIFPDKIRFLVIDGQHRIYAQKFTSAKVLYSCVIHTGLDEVQMAKLFLEINDNQRRVPASLRWDLVRLVRPEEDPYGTQAVDLIYELTQDKSSPFYEAIDLTGEIPEKKINQSSLAPEIKSIVSSRDWRNWEANFETQLKVLIAFFAAVKAVDPEGWRTAEGPFSKARVLRAVIRCMPPILRHSKVKDLGRVNASLFLPYLKKIDRNSLDTEKIKAIQGSAGIKEIFEIVHKKMFKK